MAVRVKMVAGTDFHGSRLAFESFARNVKDRDADVALLCGDITNFGTVEQAKILLSMLADVGVPVLFVPGNCDPPSLLDLKVNGLVCIHGSSFIYEGLAFVGVGGSPTTPFNTPFELSEEEIAETLDRCLKSLHSPGYKPEMVLVSHSPPKNTMLDRTFSGFHAGSDAVRRFIEEHKPLLALCGHIHEAGGKERIGRSIVVNPGPARQGNYAVIVIEEGKVSVELNR